MQKKIVIGLIVIAIIIIGGILFSRGTNQVNQNTSTTGTNTSTGSNANTTTTSGNALITLTQSELAQHNSSRDCWLLIDGNIYVATSYLPQHPGGSREITPYCGKDASTAFATQGGRGQHSNLADAQLNALLLGSLGSEVTQAKVNALN
ncbi:MAG: cytochrome b5 domain-containing protein [Candidatus Nomurabacteria bacterium]|nr:MAG: cytochrome b5 domain-containing protein [Candidatus Nomurabacteria bacterium]